MRLSLTPPLQKLGALLRAPAARFSFGYLLFAAALTLLVALRFFAEMRLQLFYTEVHRGAAHPGGIWSAPLDDVFIHFDFARSAAQGAPFHWLPGNGYSSGGTSLLYPLVLAVGYWLGATGTGLMLWAGSLACVCVLVTLLTARELFVRAALPGFSVYSVPPLLLGVGVLSWSLWSGMEVALLLAVWGACLLAWLHLSEDPEPPQQARVLRALPLGLCCAALVATRPEAVCWLLVFAVYARPRLSRLGFLRGFSSLVVIGAPGAVVLLAQAVANRIFTGDWSAAGALVKLELYHPYWTRQQAYDSWLFFIEYQLDRITEHHLSLPFTLRGQQYEAPGYLLYWLGAVGFLPRSTRRYNGLLWCSALSWVLLVALNGQVRWQNDRYTVPALALMLISAALGLGVLARFLVSARVHLLWRVPPALAATAALWVLAVGQLPLYRDQLWFFARASRNIYEQHMTAAMALRASTPRPNRVLLGDAGAIPYISRLPALDIIGLGGYHELPFARASRLGVGAIVELIEHIPAEQRPDTFALYPSWWGDLPSWFGNQRFAVPVRGNVICGGAAKVIYQADWQPLRGSAAPLSAPQNWSLKDNIDLADVLSERAHQLKLEGTVGFVVMKLLPHPADPQRDLWDAGRALPHDSTLRVRARGLGPGRPTLLLLRATATPGSVLQLQAPAAGSTTVEPTTLELGADGWQERSAPLGPVGGADPMLELTTLKGEVVVHHLWLLQN